MSDVDLDRLERRAEPLAHAFYGLMVLAVLALLFGSGGWALLLLVLGACAHVGRASLEDFVKLQRRRDGRGVKLGR